MNNHPNVHYVMKIRLVNIINNHHHHHCIIMTIRSLNGYATVPVCTDSQLKFRTILARNEQSLPHNQGTLMLYPILVHVSVIMIVPVSIRSVSNLKRRTRQRREVHIQIRTILVSIRLLHRSIPKYRGPITIVSASTVRSVVLWDTRVRNSPLFMLRHHQAPISDMLVGTKTGLLMVSMAADGAVAT